MTQSSGAGVHVVSTTPAPLADAGEWIEANDPVVPDWLRPFGGKQIAAPKAPGNRTWKAIEPAPGRYVKEKA